MNAKKINFKDPPLYEVVFAVNFEMSEFLAVHFGMYWETIKQKFPQVVDRIEEPEISETYIQTFSFPRVYFLSSEGNRLIQLKDNFFSYNCKYQKDNYPHFENLLAEFLHEWQNLESWWLNLTGEPIKKLGYQLNYLNIIDDRSGWNSPQDYSKVFTFTPANFKSSLSFPENYTCTMNFKIPNELGTLEVSLEQKELEEEGKDIVFFSLSTQNFLDNLSEPQGWFSSCHDFIIQAFFGLTQESVKEKWELCYE